MSLKLTSIKAVALGLRLSEDVVSSKGIVLAKKEQVLDSRLLEVLKSFGVMEVGAIENDENASQPLISIDLEAVEKIRDRFKNLDLKSEMIKRLFEICIERQSRSNGSTVHGV